MVNKPQYARTVDVQKTSQQTSSATPKTINLPEQKKQTRILKQKQAGASINQKLEAQRLYEKALKDLPKSGLDYNKRSTDFNKWVMMNQSVLSDPNNIEKAKKLIKNEENTLSKINKRDYNKVTGEVTIDGDYNERVEKLNTIIKDNEEVLTRGNNLEKTQKLFNIEKTKLDNYSKSIPINSAQEFNSNEFIKYNWDTGKNEIISPEKYNINYYDTGKIKSIKAKLVSFTTEYNYKKGSGAKSKDASYSPREIYFDKDGNILKEVQYRTYLDYENKDQERTSRKDKVYKSSEKIYGKNGILKSFNTWDDYKSYREKDGKDKYNQEKVYLESQKLYDPSGNLTTQKEWKDIQTEYNKYNGGYEREREVYLDKEYDYLKGTKTDYPSLGQNFMTYDLTQAEVKAAKSAPKESTVTINNSALITSEGKRIQSSNLDWLKEQQKTRGGFILDKGTYNESGINQTVSINKLLKAKSESNTMITAQDIKNATGTLDINSNLLQSTSDYNDQLKMYQNVNELIRAKGGNQGITAGELSAAVGGLGNLRGQDNLIESVAEISKANLVQLKREKQIKAEMDKEFEKKKPQFYFKPFLIEYNIGLKESFD